jgi:hypothetical protein
MDMHDAYIFPLGLPFWGLTPFCCEPICDLPYYGLYCNLVSNYFGWRFCGICVLLGNVWLSNVGNMHQYLFSLIKRKAD